MAQGTQRVLVGLLALLVVVPGGAIAATSPGEEAAIVEAWTDALLTRDSAVVEAMPWGYPQVAPSDRAGIARAVLDGLIEADAEAAALFLDPALDAATREARYAHAVDTLVSLMFDRAAFAALLQAEAASAEPPAPPASVMGPKEDALLDAVRRDVEQLAALPAGIAEAAVAAASGVGLPIAPPTPAGTSPLASFAGMVPADVAFSVCWLSAADQACAQIVPLVPLPLDVDADGLPDVLASLSVATQPADLLAAVDAGGVTPRLTFRVEQIPGIDATPLQLLILGVFTVDDQMILAGYDAFTDEAPPAARHAPQSVTIAAGATSEGSDTRAGIVLQAAGAGAALRTLAGLAVEDPWQPERLLTLDTTPVPTTLDLTLHAWEDAAGGHFEGRLETDRPIDLVAGLHERARGGTETTTARLVADGVGPVLTLAVHRGDEAETWDWETTAPIGRLAYEEETWRHADATQTTPVSWRRQAIELEGVPARIRVDVPGHATLTLESSSVLASARHVRHSYDHRSLHERYHEVTATGVPVSVSFSAVDESGSFQSVGTLGKLSFQSASLDRSPRPGDIGRLLFDLAATTTNFVGVRGETPTGGDSVAIQVLDVPSSVAFTLGETARGVDLDLVMSRGLGAIHGIVQIDDRRGILTLSNLPKDIHISADFGPAAATAGYDASSGISELMVLFTDLSLTPDPSVVHAYVQLLQLPRAASLAITRSGDAPKLTYAAATSTTDVRAFVSEALFAGDLRSRVLVAIDDLGASTTLSLVKVGADDVLRLVSEPATKSILIEGFVAGAHKGSTSKHLKERCCLNAFGYDIRYGYDMDATLVVEDLRIQLTNVRALDLTLRAPDLTVGGTFSDFVVAWDTIHILGRSSAWLRVDLVVFWVSINVWNWGWSSPTLYDLDLRITRYVDTWGRLASVTISPCTLSLDVRPSAVETTTNSFRIAGLTGGKQYLFVNPLGSGGSPAVPQMLANAYMAWRYGGWSIGFGC